MLVKLEDGSTIIFVEASTVTQLTQGKEFHRCDIMAGRSSITFTTDITEAAARINSGKAISPPTFIPASGHSSLTTNMPAAECNSFMPFVAGAVVGALVS